MFASGSGTNFEAIAAACRSGELSANISLLITNKECGANLRAHRLGVPDCVIQYAGREGYDEFDQKALDLLEANNIDLIVLAGFLRRVGPKVLNLYEGKIINIHPALLPKFGGPGMYGLRVHQAVIESGDVLTGSTIHFVTAEYDKGSIVAQTQVKVLPGDTPEILAQRVQGVENSFYVSALKKLIPSLKNK